MRIIIDSVDLRKYDAKIDDVLKELVEDLLKMSKERKEKHDISSDVAIAHYKYLLLKATVIISHSIENKILNLLENADNDIIDDLT